MMVNDGSGLLERTRNSAYNTLDIFDVFALNIKSYIDLLKPELTGLSVLTTLSAFVLASTSGVHFWPLFLTGIGTAMVGGGAGALNQYMERSFDAMMRRTQRRPLPSGRISPARARVFGVTMAGLGVFILTFLVRVETGLLASLTLALYLLAYTPLKRKTWLNTVVGAIPGAIPVLVGWSAPSGKIAIGGWIFFALLFVWQLPHFLSLAMMYRSDYQRAGFKMLPVLDDDRGTRSSGLILASTLLLTFIGVPAAFIGGGGTPALIASLLLGIVFTIVSVRLFTTARMGDDFSARRLHGDSRRVFFASLVYLPLLMATLVLARV